MFVITVPLNSVIQSINAAHTFTFLPKKEDPGFAAVSDKSVLSYYTIVENSFYASQLLFACCYLHDKYFKIKIKSISHRVKLYFDQNDHLRYYGSDFVERIESSSNLKLKEIL